MEASKGGRQSPDGRYSNRRCHHRKPDFDGVRVFNLRAPTPASPIDKMLRWKRPSVPPTPHGWGQAGRFQRRWLEPCLPQWRWPVPDAWADALCSKLTRAEWRQWKGNFATAARVLLCLDQPMRPVRRPRGIAPADRHSAWETERVRPALSCTTASRRAGLGGECQQRVGSRLTVPEAADVQGAWSQAKLAG